MRGVFPGFWALGTREWAHLIPWFSILSGTVSLPGAPSFPLRGSLLLGTQTPPPGSRLGRTARSPLHCLQCFADKAWLSSPLFGAYHCVGAQ